LAAFVNCAKASIASRANTRDDREAPLWWKRDGRDIHGILISEKQNIFDARGGHVGQIRCNGASAPVYRSWDKNRY